MPLVLIVIIVTENRGADFFLISVELNAVVPVYEAIKLLIREAFAIVQLLQS